MIVLAVVANTEGFLKYSQVFEGNIADSNTLEKIITELSLRTSSAKRRPTVVLGACIATENKLKLLKGFFPPHLQCIKEINVSCQHKGQVKFSIRQEITDEFKRQANETYVNL